MGLRKLECNNKMLMKDKIVEWLKKTGYPLELYGEFILNELGFFIVNSHLYVDTEKQISRELDLLACYRKEENNVNLSLNLLIECKKTDKPLILLATSEKVSKNSISFGEFISISNPHMRALIGSAELSLEMPGKSGYGFKIIQAFTDGDELIHKASNTLFKSLLDFNNESQEYLEIYIENNEYRLGMPILLIDAPLVELKLNESKEMEIHQIDSCILEYKNPLNTMEDTFFIPIIKKEFFKEFCSNLENISTSIIQNLSNKPLQQIKNYNRTEIKLVKKKITFSKKE